MVDDERQTEAEALAAAGATKDEAGSGHVCPECGEEFSSPMRLGLHRYQKHGIRGRDAQRKAAGGGSRRSTSASRPGESRQAKRRRAVRETLLELTDFTDELRGRGRTEPVDLADVIRRDADKIADALAHAAERFNPLAFAIDKLAGHGGVITFARGFLGLGTWLARKWRQGLAARERGDVELTLGEDGRYHYPDGTLYEGELPEAEPYYAEGSDPAQDGPRPGELIPTAEP
jgi:hypothetical protein